MRPLKNSFSTKEGLKVEIARNDLESRGLQYVDEEAWAEVEGLPYGRKYDLVMFDPDLKRYVGFEIKTSMGNPFRLKSEQVIFDALAVTDGAIAYTGQGPVTINVVSYYGVNFGGQLAQQWSTSRLHAALTAMRIPWEVHAHDGGE